LTLSARDLLVLATEGRIEVRDSNGSMFGVDRLQKLISENQDESAAVTANVLPDARQGFHRRSHPLDDSTVPIIKRNL
jgi:serine phosphatase RsbU (regulator of sigma subunit)